MPFYRLTSDLPYWRAGLLVLSLLPASHGLADELQLPSQEVRAARITDEDGYQAKRASTASTIAAWCGQRCQ